MSSANKRLLTSFLLIPVVAHADPGLGSLIILAYPIIFSTGLAGVFVATLVIRRILRNQGNVTHSAKVPKALALLYVGWAVLLYEITVDMPIMKLIGAMALVIALLLGVLFLKPRHNYLLTAYLLVVGAWGFHWLELYYVEYVDNSAAINAVQVMKEGQPFRQLLYLKDGRRVLQIEPSDPKEHPWNFDFAAGDYVTLKKIESEHPGNWFEVTHYSEKPESLSNRRGRDTNSFTFFTIELDRYKQSSTPTIAVLLDESTEIDYSGLLLKVLGDSLPISVVRELATLGPVNIHSQKFVNEAFKSEEIRTYLTLAALGLALDETDLHGNTLMHRAAYIGDPDTMWDLYERGGQLETKNAAGQTPLAVYRDRHKHSPIAMRRLDSYSW